ncbi:MAG: FAD-dependent oxidoreductase [Betaproteobacteria bacterium]|nr:FAD-dependent oxidoreductase [Betaproteobacteria bacterium]
MENSMIIVGGGIGGLAAALACGQAGARPQVLERAATFSEVGAGIQMGPNVTRTLHAWGLAEDLKAIGFAPRKLEAKDTQTGQVIGSLRLGQQSLDTYGAPYVTVHRADLHRVLLQKLMRSGLAQLRLDSEVEAVQQAADGIQISGTNLPASLTEFSQFSAMVGADGLWSATRQFVVPPTTPRVTGLLAYRALLPMQFVPEKLRLQDVNVWLGPKVHAVLYPVQCGECLNVVVVVQGRTPANLTDWDHAGNKEELVRAMGPIHADLRDMLAAVPAWRLWPLCDRPPLQGPHEMAKGRIALLGDAAHPMRPFLAQGAGMAIEDAAELARSWARADLPVEDRLKMYAQARWARNAQVQQRSIRNGQIFHLQGPLRWGRNVAMKLMGESLMDVPWLYAGP